MIDFAQGNTIRLTLVNPGLGAQQQKRHHLLITCLPLDVDINEFIEAVMVPFFKKLENEGMECFFAPSGRKEHFVGGLFGVTGDDPAVRDMMGAKLAGATYGSRYFTRPKDEWGTILAANLFPWRILDELRAKLEEAVRKSADANAAHADIDDIYYKLGYNNIVRAMLQSSMRILADHDFRVLFGNYGSFPVTTSSDSSLTDYTM